jgi:2,3-bisphosphoglycerate-independent phosphoglycerate mutase
MTSLDRPPLVGLVILDGWGLRASRVGNAVALARTPVMDRLYGALPEPRASLVTCGESVGLPAGQMGNSEVGHLNLGAGRIVYQDLTRIDRAVAEGALATNGVWTDALGAAVRRGRIHFVGLLSPGGVHSHERHLFAMIDLAARAGVGQILVHAILDGRDTPPRSAAPSLEAAERVLRASAPGRGSIATVMGRFYAMDRDKRWDRTERAYRAAVLREGERAGSAAEALAKAYARGEGDEFVVPTVVERRDGAPSGAERGDEGAISAGDVVVAFNFRPDRMRQITRALADPAFAEFPRPAAPADVSYVCMTRYEDTFPHPVLFDDEPLRRTVGEVVSQAGIRQLRIAETEKYAHVTYFFNGSEETPFQGEERALIPSPRVATYDLQPEMSAAAVTDAAVRRLSGPDFGFFVLNYANADMVGHTGVLPAAIRAVETVDECLGRVLQAVEVRGGVALVTADHGNAEQMIDESTGEPHTAHTLNPVPIVLAGLPGLRLGRSGILADVAPTLLALLRLPAPLEMTGSSLLAPP